MIVSNSEKYAKVLKSAREADKSLTTLDGALAVVTKFWNNGYNAAAQELGFGKPSELAKVFRAGAAGGFPAAMFGANAKGVRVVGLWKAVKQYDMDESKAVTDALGRVTHPYLLDERGEVVTRDTWREVKRWSPAMVFEVLVQAQYLAMQAAMQSVAAAEGVAPENVDYLAQRALDKLHAANAAAKSADELQQVLCLPAPAPVAAPSAEAEAAPAAEAEEVKPVATTRRATTRRKATAKAAA